MIALARPSYDHGEFTLDAETSYVWVQIATREWIGTSLLVAGDLDRKGDRTTGSHRAQYASKIYRTRLMPSFDIGRIDNLAADTPPFQPDDGRVHLLRFIRAKAIGGQALSYFLLDSVNDCRHGGWLLAIAGNERQIHLAGFDD